MKSFMFFFSSRRRHTRFSRDWSSDVCSSDLSGRSPPALCSRSPAPPAATGRTGRDPPPDRKSTRLNSSHVKISYAVFCLKKKKKTAKTACATSNKHIKQPYLNQRKVH